MCMADAYARLTRRPSFVEVHIAPGLGNALGMMHNARIGKTPMVVFAGQSPTNVLLQEPHLSGPLVDMARPIAKWSAQVEHAHDVVHGSRKPQEEAKKAGCSEENCRGGDIRRPGEAQQPCGSGDERRGEGTVQEQEQPTQHRIGRPAVHDPTQQDEEQRPTSH